MSVNPYKLKKQELLTFYTKRCKHRHLYSEHPGCFIAEQEYEPKIGFFDIETNGLNGNFHIVLSYALKTIGKNDIIGRTITKEELHSETLDKNIVEDCVKDMLRFDRLVTYYGTWFDIPFVRTRALKWGINEFPVYGLVRHTDVYYLVKSKLNLNRRRLENVARLLGVKGKTHVKPDTWLKAAIQGDKKALGYIFNHNKRDVVVLEKVWKKLKLYSREYKRSL